jgi:outer membrane autotransporter protein
MSMFRLLLAFVAILGFLLSAQARAECGGTTQCIGVGPTVGDAQVAHHGLGPDTFTLNFGDQGVGSISGSRTIFVEAVTGPAGSMVQLAPTTITGADANSFILNGGSCSASNGPVNGGAGCTILVAFGPGTTGPKSATVHVNLAFPGCVGCITERVVTVTGNGVPPSATAPVANNVSVDVPFGTSRAIDLAASVSGSYSTIFLASSPAHGTATLSGTTVTYTPAAGYIGPDSFTYGATGPGGTSNTATVSISVVSPGAPTAAPLSVSTPFDTPAAVDLAASITGAFTSVAIASQPQRGTASLSGTIVTYRPSTGFVGTDTFTYTATGPGGTSAAATVTVTVIATAPTAAPATLTVQVNTPTVLDTAPLVSGSGVSTVNIVSRPAHGTATVSGLRITYTPAVDYFGPDSFTYAAVGVAGTSAPATVTVNVIGRPDPTRNPTVTGLLAAQAASAERFSQAQIANFQGRMESLHRRESVPPRATAQAPAQRTDEARADVPAPSFLQASYASASQLPFASAAVSLLTSGGVAVDRNWANFWVSGNARFGHRGPDGTMQGLEFTTSGISLGVDRRFSDRFAMGLGVGYGRDTTDIGTDGSYSKARSVSLGAYGSYQPTPSTFVDTVIGYGSLDFTSRRFVVPMNDYASADRDGDYFFASIAAGYERRGNGVLFSPYGRIDHSNATLDAAAESGAGVFALAYGRQRNPITQGALGVRAESIREAHSGWFNLRGRAEWRHLFKGAGSATIHYVDIPGVDYLYSPVTTERNSLMLGVGTEYILRNGLTAGIEYQYLRASARDSDQGIRLYISQALGKGGYVSWLPGFRMEPTKPLDLQVDAGFMYDDNVSRAQLAADELTDYSFSANARLSHVFGLSEHVRAVGSAVLGGEAFRKYSGLTRGTAGVEGELQYRASGAWGTPTWALFANAHADAYESNLRDGARYAAGASVRVAVTDKISFFGAYTHNRRTAEGEVFDGRDNSVRGNFDWQWDAKRTIYLTGEYRRGDVVGSGKAPGPGNFFPHTHDYENTALESLDDAFPGLDYHAYRFKADTTIATLGYNWSIGPRESIDFSWRRVDSKPRGSWGVETLYGTVILGKYVTHQFLLLYLASF